MEVGEIEAFPIAIPLDEPVSFATRTVEHRDHVIVRIRSEDGIEGVGYSLGYDSADLLAEAVEDRLAPLVTGSDPRETTRLWQRMFEETIQVGRRGLFLRAISAVDIALWDLVAKAAEMPLYKFIGAARSEAPAYASGGYYRADKDTAELQAELHSYVDAGHDTVKMKVGGASKAIDRERVLTAREAIGPERTLLLDANGAWSDAPTALDHCRSFAEADPYWIEEPAMPDRIDLLARINHGLEYAVATGELEATRYGFASLQRADAATIWQPDATVVGGITEWLRVAGAAATADIPIAPHYNWNLHTSLVCAAEPATWVEYFYRDRDVKVFDDVVEDPVVPEDGMVHPPEQPGHGVSLDERALDKYRGMPE